MTDEHYEDDEVFTERQGRGSYVSDVVIVNPWPETDDEKGWYDDWRNEVYAGNAISGFRDWMASEKTANEEYDEQAERDARTDLCDACRDVDHVSCSLDASCACCRTTITAMEDDQ